MPESNFNSKLHIGGGIIFFDKKVIKAELLSIDKANDKLSFNELSSKQCVWFKVNSNISIYLF